MAGGTSSNYSGPSPGVPVSLVHPGRSRSSWGPPGTWDSRQSQHHSTWPRIRLASTRKDSRDPVRIVTSSQVHGRRHVLFHLPGTSDSHSVARTMRSLRCRHLRAGGRSCRSPGMLAEGRRRPAQTRGTTEMLGVLGTKPPALPPHQTLSLRRSRGPGHTRA